MKKCNNCGLIVPDDVKFCRGCGADLRDPSNYKEVNEDGSEIRPATAESSAKIVRKCNKCGNIVSDTAKFCNVCGADMHDSANYTMVDEATGNPVGTTDNEGKDKPAEEPKAPVHPVKKCNKCGNIVSDTAKFCNVCGADMNDSANYTMVDEATGNPVGTTDTAAEEPVKADPSVSETAETEEISVEKPQETGHQVKKCKICGNIVPDSMRFCNSCGADMNDRANYTLVDDPLVSEKEEPVENAASVETPEPVKEETETPVTEEKDVEESTEPAEEQPVSVEENVAGTSGEAEVTTDASEPVEENTDESSENPEQKTETEVHTVRKCKRCGNIVPDDVKFCNVCGADMRDPGNYTAVDEETGRPVEEFTAETESSEPVSEEPAEVNHVTTEETTEPAGVVEETSESSETNEEASVPETSDETTEEASVQNTETNDQTVQESSEDTAESETPSHTEESAEQEETPEESSEDTEEPAADEPADVTSANTTAEDSSENSEATEETRKEPADLTEDSSEKAEEIPSEPEKPVHQVKKCNKCGNIVPDDVKFCNICGADMNDSANYTMVTEDNDQTAETEKEPVHKVKKCNTCGSIVPDDAKFCNTCGADMQNPANYSLIEEAPVHKVKKCNKCGNIVPDGVKFCNVCGADMQNPANYSMVEEQRVPKVKKCNRCGNIVEDGAKFCNVCGADMNDPANYTMVDAPKNGIDKEQVRQAVNEAGAVASATVQGAADAVNKAVQSDKVQGFLHNKKAVIASIAAVAAVVVLLIVHALMPKTIDLNKYATISVTGYDGHGTAEVSINEEKLKNDIYAAAQKKGTTQYIYSADFDPTYKLDKKENLSNGDTVTLTWDVDPNALSTLKIRLKTNDNKKKVSDLKKADTFDAFKGIKVQVKGAAPYGEAELNKDTKDGLVYKLNKSTGLSNGDKIKVTVSSSYYDDKNFTTYVQEKGKIPAKTTKTFEVSDLDTYITSVNDLSNDVIKKMRSQAEDVIKANDASNLSDDAHLDSLTYQGLYFLKAKDRKDEDDDDYYDDAYNKVYIVEKQTFTTTDWDDYTYTEEAYTAVEFNSISKASDGTINVDLSDYSLADNGFYTSGADVYVPGYETQDDLYEDCVTSQLDEYESETKAAS